MHKNKMILLFTFLLLLHLNVLFGQIQYENQFIEKIDILAINLPSGASFDKHAVTSRIKTHAGDIFSQNDFDNDLKVLALEYDRVEPELTSIDGRLYIVLKVWPKPTIRTITWRGNSKITSKYLQKELGIASCAIFDRLAFNRAFHKLKTYYIKQGFFEASLNYDVNYDPETNEVDIVVNICEGRAGRIQRINFRNFTSCEIDEIYDMMATKTFDMFTSWFSEEGTYNEDAVQQDQYTILNYLQNRGYADARVHFDVCESKMNNRIIITITAEKGQIYRFGKVSFEGNCLFSDEEIWSQILFCEGDCYSPEKIRETSQRISDLYGRRGYIDALIDFEPKLNPDGCSYSVHLTIEEGEQYRVGLIKVFGNCSTQTNVILHETIFVPGQIFNAERIQKTEEKLRNIGYFSHVNVYAVKSEGPPGLVGNYRDVHIEVEETNTGNFGAGFGVSSIESVFGELRITEKNFNYKGLKYFLSEGGRVLRGGGEYLHLSATVGAKARKYLLSWTKPYFNDTPWVVGFELENSSNRYVSKDYDIKGSGLLVHGSFQVNPFLREGVHYRLRYTDVNLTDHKDNKQMKEETRGGLISAVGVSLNYDSTNHPTDPTCGFKSRLEAEFAGVGGRSVFTSLAYLNTYYYPISRKGTIKLRGDFRFIIPMLHTRADKVPIDERLFLGGESMIRGYRAYKLGPKFDHGDPRGGMSLQFLSIEYNHKLTSHFDGFLYCDAGQLSFDTLAFGELRVAAGIGIRFKLFASGPPLMLGIGYPFNPRKRGDVKSFFFTVGGRF